MQNKVLLYTNKKGNSEKVASEFAKVLASEGFEIVTSNPDVVISFGGDGTFLRSFQAYFKETKRYANVNCGNLGYLCEFSNNDANKVSSLLRNNNAFKPIAVLECKANNKTFNALNEFRVESASGDTIIFDVYIDGIYLETLRGDGACVASTLGSSGICRSLGGALIDPKNGDLLEFVEKAPLLNRDYQSIRSPIILSKESRIILKNFAHKKCKLSFDASSVEIEDENLEIEIGYSDLYIELLKNKENEFSEKIREAFIYESK